MADSSWWAAVLNLSRLIWELGNRLPAAFCLYSQAGQCCGGVVAFIVCRQNWYHWYPGMNKEAKGNFKRPLWTQTNLGVAIFAVTSDICIVYTSFWGWLSPFLWTPHLFSLPLTSFDLLAAFVLALPRRGRVRHWLSRWWFFIGATPVPTPSGSRVSRVVAAVVDISVVIRHPV